MHYISNIEALSTNSKFNTYEYELEVDSHLVGNFDQGPYEIDLWEYNFHKEGEKRKIILRIKKAETPFEELSGDFSRKNAYYHGGGIEDEIVAFASLFLRRRIKLVHLVRENDTPLIISTKNNGWIDKELIRGKSKLSDLSDWFPLLENLDQSYHQKFVLATRLYHRSIIMIEDEPDLAYLTLVSSIEALCRDHPLKEKPTLSEIFPTIDAKIENLNVDKEIKHDLREDIIDKQAFIARKFVDFIIYYTTADFWKYENRSKHGQIKPDELPRYLKNIYNQRSKTLHEGQAFPPTIFIPPKPLQESPIGLSFMHMGKIWKPNDYIPNIYFFFFFFNYVLKNFLKLNQINHQNV